MKAFPFPLITITLFLATGIVVNSLCSPNIFFITSLLIIAFIGLLVSYFMAKKYYAKNQYFGLFAYLISFILGMLLHYGHFQPNQNNHYTHFISNQQKSVITGNVASVLKSSLKNDKYVLKINSINNEIASGTILLYNTKENSKQITPGDEIIATVSLLPISKNYNPYQFDYSQYLEKQNIFHQVFLKENDVKIIQKHKNFDYYLFQIRASLINSFAHHHWNSETLGIINALLFGQKTHLDKEIMTAYSNAGVIHVLAISGLHVGIIYLFIAFLLKPLNRFKKGKIVQLLIVLFLLWSFASLTGFSASVSRAVTLFSIIAIGKFWSKQVAIFNLVAASALLLLLIKPNFIFDIGFQLSYAAVLSILLFQPYYEKFYFTKNKIICYGIDLVLVSLAAQIGVLPLSLYYFNQFPLLFLVANIFVIPTVTALLILGIITLCCNFILPDLALFLGKIISFIIQLMNHLISWISNYEQFTIKNISFSFALCFFAYLVITTFLYWLYKGGNKRFQYLLIGFFLFQITYISTSVSSNNTSELLIYNSKQTLISIKKQATIDCFTDNPETNIEHLTNYKRGVFSNEINLFPLQNTFVFNKHKILIIDSLGYFKTSQNPDIIVLTQNARINLERIVQEVKPKLIVADNSNSFYKIKMWLATCEKEKIPFHATAEKGFYRLE